MVPPCREHAVVVKVGGSLYDLPDLGARLRSYLVGLNSLCLVLVPGGGAAANMVRAWDRKQGLGDEKAHWLALRALTFNAHFLASLLPETRVIEHLDECHGLVASGRVPILDMYAWALADEKRPGHLPHTWDVTSDSLAACVAIEGEATQLILLKSVAIPEGMAWEKAAQAGLVDPYFPELMRQAPDLEVRMVNLRE